MNAFKTLNRKNHVPHFETLESRTVLSGNVQATFLNGTVTLQGDAADNQLSITQIGDAFIRVTGRENTLINARHSVVLPVIKDDLILKLNQGGSDDVIVQGPLAIGDDLTATLSRGRLDIDGTIKPIQINGDIVVTGGREADFKMTNSVEVEGSVTVSVGGSVAMVAAQSLVPDFRAARFADSLNIDNPYTPMIPGTTYHYRSEFVDEETGEPHVETTDVEVLSSTKVIQGVTTREIRDRVYLDGNLIEDTTDWVAQDDNGNVWYFGEFVTDYDYDEQGNVIGIRHDGSWLAGKNGAKAGIFMEAKPQVDDRYFQEVLAQVALDQATIVSTDESVTVNGKHYSHVLVAQESTVVEPSALESKYYLPGLGKILSERLDPHSEDVLVTSNLISVTQNGKVVWKLVDPAGFVGTNAVGKVMPGIEIDGRVNLRGDAEIVLRGVETEMGMRLNSRNDIRLWESNFQGPINLRAGATYSVRDSEVAATFLATGAADAYFMRSQFLADANLTFGPGDNHVVIDDSFFSDLDASGGLGENTIEIEDSEIEELETSDFVVTWI